MSRFDAPLRTAVVVAAVVVAAVVGGFVFLAWASDLADLAGILLTVALAGVAVRVGSSVADSVAPGYNVAEVAVEGPITRDGSTRPFPGRIVGATANEVVDLIQRADEDPNAEGLLVRLNTPGGEVVPSDDIRRAAAEFDGPTVGYAVDTCASGGYWIASGCDEVWAHEASVVGSIGVIGSTVNVSGLAERLGVSYERFAAGKYKDAGTALKELSEDERAYLQGIIDEFYDHFVERVAAGRDLDPEAIRDTEARVFLGEEAHERGLVDELGATEDVEERMEELLGEPLSVAEFTPQRGLASRLRGGAQAVAYAVGAGVASHVAPGDDREFRLRF